jgi:Fe2+ transport system protein FeoA
MGQPDSEGRKYIVERTIAGNLAALLTSMGILLGEAAYFGPVDVGVAVT